jgi:putative redox protein
MTKVDLALQDGMRFEARGEDGVTVTLDTEPEHGGTSSGLRPLELLLAGLGGCTGMDVLAILRKKRQDVTGYRVEVSGEQATEHPHVFTQICIVHILEGNDLREEAVRRAIELSETKYCPAFAMLSKAAEVASRFQIVPAGPND